MTRSIRSGLKELVTSSVTTAACGGEPTVFTGCGMMTLFEAVDTVLRTFAAEVKTEV